MYIWSWNAWVFLGLLFVQGLLVLIELAARKSGASGKTGTVLGLTRELTGIGVLVFLVFLLVSEIAAIMPQLEMFPVIQYMIVVAAVAGGLLGIAAVLDLLARFRVLKTRLSEKIPPVMIALGLIALVLGFFLAIWGNMGSWPWYDWIFLVLLIIAGLFALVELFVRRSTGFGKLLESVGFSQSFVGLGLVVFSVLTLVLEIDLVLQSLPLIPLTAVIYIIALITGIALGALCLLDFLRSFRLVKEEFFAKLLAPLRIVKVPLGLIGILTGLYLVVWSFEQWLL